MTEIQAPTVCPDCGGPVTAHTESASEITTHWCENIQCPGRIADMLAFVAGREILEIEGLGPEMAALLAKSGHVTDLARLFEFTNAGRETLARVGPERFAAGMNKRGIPGAATIKMIETAERAKTATWDRWIAALGIPMISLSLGKTLAKELELSPEDLLSLGVLFDFGKDDTRQIEGLGFHKKGALTEFANDSRSWDICRRLYVAGVRPQPLAKPIVAAGAPLAGMVFCITGELYTIGSREYVTQELVKLGAVAKSGVSGKVTHLIVGTEPGRTKLEKAEKLKVKQYDEDWVTEMFKKYGVKVTGADLSVEWA